MSAVDLEDLTLARGGHNVRSEGVCLLEAVAWVAGEEHSDQPKCVSPVLGAYGRRLNDRLSDEDRQKLKSFIPLMVGTAGDGQDEARRWLASDWAIRVATPRWLDAAGLTVHAARLRDLQPVVDYASARLARDAARAARDEAYAARVRSRDSLAAKIRVELEKRGKSVAVAAADAAADAVAVAVADAVAVAVAAADDRYWAIYDAVKAKLRELYRSKLDESKYAEVARVNNAEAIELLGRMIDPSKAVA